jgi:hypothetical protein
MKSGLLVLLIVILLGVWFKLDDSSESDKFDWNDGIFLVIMALFGYLCINAIEEFVKGHSYSSTLILIENRMTETVHVQWVTQKAAQPLEPNHVVSCKVKEGILSYFSKPPASVKISYDKNGTQENATIILFVQSELYHTKVYKVTDEGIQELRNPDHRSWHTGEMKCYQTE